MNLFKKLCKQNQEWKYTFLRDKLHQYTKQQVTQRKAAREATVAAHAAAVAAQAATGETPPDTEPVGLCDLPGFDPPGTRRRFGRQIKNFAQWIEHEPLERWSLLHDTHGARYGVMTTNLAESYVGDMPEFPTVRVLHRVFFSFSVCIEAFSHCRPVLCVDGTFLTGKYKGQILTAIGQDGNNQLVPLAFAFVESENTESWLWFFRQLKIAIVKDKPYVCILHDRHAGILNAIKTLKQSGPDEPMPWQDIESRWCMRHLGANFFSQFRSKNLMNLFKKLCKQNQEWKYTFLRGKLDEFTKIQVRQRKAA